MTKDRALDGRMIVLAVTGSVAAYKAVEVARLLVKAGAQVVPVMTPSAERFVGAVTFAGICGRGVVRDMWDPSFAGEVHVDIADEADAVAIVPATADVLARLAAGHAGDVVTALALVAKGPVIVAPAMHPRMWGHPATQRNVAALAEQGRVTLVGPVEGPVASGEAGWGRMSEPSAIVQAIALALAPKDLVGRRVLVTAGPTYEDLDPVRYLGNRSTGKMGFRIAERAAARGAQVTLVAGPVSLASPAGVRRVDVRSALEMQAAIDGVVGEGMTEVDAVVMAAAVADYRPVDVSKVKTKKEGERAAIALLRNPDIIAAIGARRRGPAPFLVAFALETGTDEAIVLEARRKLDAKKVDLVVANPASEAFGGETNRATFVTSAGAEPLPTLSKRALADRILDAVFGLEETRGA